MKRKKEPRFAYVAAAVLLIIGIVSYTFPAKAPEEPLRMIFSKGVAGTVFFDHEAHTAETGYGILCGDCHHHPEDDEDRPECGKCHLKGGEKAALPKSCMECHEADDIEGSTMKERTKAFHDQCIGCHEAGKAGPTKCDMCHAM